MRRLMQGVLVASLIPCAVGLTYGKEETATVLRVVDGDTLLVQIDGAEERVR